MTKAEQVERLENAIVAALEDNGDFRKLGKALTVEQKYDIYIIIAKIWNIDLENLA